MTEEHLVTLAQHIHVWFSVLRIAETVFRTLAMTEKEVVAALAFKRKGIALVAPEALLLATAVHCGKVALHDVSQPVFGIHKVVA